MPAGLGLSQSLRKISARAQPTGIAVAKQGVDGYILSHTYIYIYRYRYLYTYIYYYIIILWS